MLYTEDFSMHHYVGFSQIGSHFMTCLFMVQITHNLNGKRVCAMCAKAKNTRGIKPCVKYMHHTHVLIHMKYLPRNDLPYNL